MTKTVTIEKEVWESTLRQSMKMTAKSERLEKKLEIAVRCIKNYKSGTTDKWFAEVALEQIEELNK